MGPARPFDGGVLAPVGAAGNILVDPMGHKGTGEAQY